MLYKLEVRNESIVLVFARQEKFGSVLTIEMEKRVSPLRSVRAASVEMTINGWRSASVEMMVAVGEGYDSRLSARMPTLGAKCAAKMGHPISVGA